MLYELSLGSASKLVNSFQSDNLILLYRYISVGTGAKLHAELMNQQEHPTTVYSDNLQI